ncbi:PREDICTED: major facilitator superfamily domain-containing protein 6 [Drosophila arizonae]|uniref:Major facilitator superfamily domain-containing protein 6 n=1 Tax=Drosophila arizonae TaxID=7263 RepID=A0ABM1P9B5_DROAR|nr:PREDICTED: major facilitator superfamily domain-containing protein 6 [Drosophila arizonae]
MGFKGGSSPRINKTLISLKLVVFLIISGLTALHILHATKPLLLGLNFSEYRTITIAAAFVSILGPVIAGPWADRLAARNPNGFGRTLRRLTAVFLLLTALIYAMLFFVPEVAREPAVEPDVNFGCDANGAFIFQKLCSNGTCHNWEHKKGSVKLTHCTYSCLNPNYHENMYQFWLGELPTAAPSTEQSSEFDYDQDDLASATTEKYRPRRDVNIADLAADSAGVEQISSEVLRVKRQVKSAPKKVYVEPPHLCITERNEQGENIVKHCHVYTQDTPNIVVHADMGPAMDEPKTNETIGWCQYPLAGIQCNIPPQQVKYMKDLTNGTECKPVIECMIVDAYDGKDSVLADSECITTTGSVDDTLISYLIIRLLGDVFALAALTLLNTAIVIAVRETSEGRGEVCRQYVWGAIGYVILFSPLDLLFKEHQPNHDAALAALIILIVCFVLGAVVLLSASQMPLSPPEWWWHTKTGMLVVPMSAIRRYSPEIAVLTLVAILFGTFWSSVHSFLFWTFTDVNAICYSGIILILVLFFNVDKFIEYCGHSNIFIAGFAIFVIRFTALSDAQTNWLTVVMETIEPAVIGLIWITIILYMRHAMPRKLTATGQAIAVLAFFGLGKGFGALIGLAREEKHPKLPYWTCTYQWLAIVACIIAFVYFVIYNLILAPRCTAKPQHSEELISGSASQNFGTNGTASNGNGAGNGAGIGPGAGAALNGNGNANGSYSPLRVYHNERGKKGQFRY